MPNHKNYCGSRQEGAVLITTFIMLIAIMMLGLAASTVSRDQYKLAANQQFQSATFNEAEAAIAAAETWLITGNNFGSAGFVTRANATPHLYPSGFLSASMASTDPLRMVWDDTTSIAVGGQNRRYLVERIATNKSLMGTSSDKKNVNLYRIIARAEGVRGTVRFVQTIFSVRCYDAEAKTCSEYN